MHSCWAVFFITKTEAYKLSWNDHNFLQRELSAPQNYSKEALWSSILLLAVRDMNQMPATIAKFGFQLTAVSFYWTRFTLQVYTPLHIKRLWAEFWNTVLEQIRYHGPDTAFSQPWRSLFRGHVGISDLERGRTVWIPLLFIWLAHGLWFFCNRFNWRKQQGIPFIEKASFTSFYQLCSKTMFCNPSLVASTHWALFFLPTTFLGNKTMIIWGTL